MESFKVRGRWGVPHDKKIVSGELTYNPDNGIELDITGILPESNTIIGTSDYGEQITIHGCFSRNVGSSGEKITANYIFIGAHFESEEHIVFSDVSFSCTNLDEWMWHNSFEVKTDHNTRTCAVIYSLPKPVTAKINDMMEITLLTNASLPPTSLVQHHISIKEKSYVRLSANQPIPFLEFLNPKYIFDCFLHLATGRPQNALDFWGTSHSQRIQIYYTPYNIAPVKQILPPNMLFNYRNIQAVWPQKISLWYNRFHELEDIATLYFFISLQNSLSLQQRFLFLVQVLESYHRRTRTNHTEAKAKRQKIEEIIESSNEEYRDFLKEKLGFAHEPSLRERLNQLFDECVIFNQVLGHSTLVDRESFLKGICDTRNYHTHYDKRLEKKAKTGAELYHICEKLKVIIQYYLLFELEFVPHEISMILNNVHHFDIAERMKEL